jgi:membrane protease YdiL (CAAX protease family)
LRPTNKQWLVLIVCVILTSVVALIAYRYTGETIVSRSHVIETLTERGFEASFLLPLAVYFIIVNSILEELFWRGVILNELEELAKPWRIAGTTWTAITFAAWHWLVLRALLQPGYAELAVLGVLAMGCLASWLYRKTQSIVVAILWHALVFDMAIIAVFAAMILQG